MSASDHTVGRHGRRAAACAILALLAGFPAAGVPPAAGAPAAGIPAAGAPEAEQVTLSGWQEITILTVSKLEHASASCGFKLGWQQISVLLESASLTIEQVHSLPRGPDLQKQIDDDAAGYRADRIRACAEAWDTFGADAAARDLLTR